MRAPAAPRRIWRRLRRLADTEAQRLALAALPIQVEAAGRAGRASRVVFPYKTHTHTLWLDDEPARVRTLIAAARKSQFGKANRISGSVAQGHAAWSRLAPAKSVRPLDCLFIGYGLDTYDAQLLANLGLPLRAEFLDVLDPDPADPRWLALQRTPGISGTAYHQMDARQVAGGLAGRRYDLIAIVRGSVDLMPPQDYMAVLEGCCNLLAEDGRLLAPVIALQFTPRVLKAARRQFWLGETVALPRPTYKSKLGEFHLDRLGQYRYLDLAFDADPVDYRRAIVEQLRLFAVEETAFAELSDLLEGEAAPDWLEKMATLNGQAGRILTSADLPGAVSVTSFDISRRPRRGDERWTFTVRATLALRRPGP